ESEIIELQANGIRFFNLGSIEKRKIIPRTERVYIGKDAWNVHEDTSDFTTSHIPTMDDWNKPSDDMIRRVVPIKEGSRGVLLQDEIFTEHIQQHYSLGLFYEGQEIVMSTIPSST